MRAPLPRPARGHRRPRSRPLSKAAGLQGACHRGLWNWRHSRPSSPGSAPLPGTERRGRGQGGPPSRGAAPAAPSPPPAPAGLPPSPRLSLPAPPPVDLLTFPAPPPMGASSPSGVTLDQMAGPGLSLCVLSRCTTRPVHSVFSEAHEPTRAAVPPCSAALPSPLSRVFPSVSFSSVPTGMSAPGGQTISSRPCPAPPGVGGSGCGAGSGAVQQVSEYLNSRFPALSLSLSPSHLPPARGLVSG